MRQASIPPKFVAAAEAIANVPYIPTTSGITTGGITTAGLNFFADMVAGMLNNPYGI